ncbi:MAG: hypothetical protein EBR71_11785 [Planctomycetes bacterium]|nr:hypothetical protein [Planctomycetota bacterium]
MSDETAVDAWTALLAQAGQLAAASRAWPRDAEGDRMRASVTPLVQLQAVRIAMEQLDRLPAASRAYARDQAEVLVQRSCEALRHAWHGEPMPAWMLDIMAASRDSIAASLYAGLRGLRWNGAQPMVVPAWRQDVTAALGTLAVMEPGTIALPGECIAWWTERTDLSCEGCEVQPMQAPVQVYRRFDESGRYAGSAEVPLHEPLPAGMPMLVPLFVAGQPVGALQRDAQAWLAMQVAAGVPQA